MFDRSFDGASFDAHEGPMRCCLVPRSNDCQTVADTRRVVGSCWLCGAHRACAAALAVLPLFSANGRGRAGGRRPRGGAVGVGGCARLPSSAAGMRSVSSTRLRCAWTLWAVSGNPSGIPGSTMGLATGTSARLRAGHDACRAPGSAARWGRAGRKLADARGSCDRVVSNESRSLHGRISSSSAAL